MSKQAAKNAATESETVESSPESTRLDRIEAAIMHLACASPETKAEIEKILAG